MPALPEALPRTNKVLQKGIQRGHHFGGQIAICHEGNLIVDNAFGTLGPGTDEAMTPDKILCWRSAGKPWTAIALLQLVEAGEISLDQTIDAWFHDDDWSAFFRSLPADAAMQSQPPTVRQILTHTTGWQPMETGWPDIDVDASLKRVMRSPLRDGAVVGETAAYDPQAGWLVLGEIIFKATGLEVAEVVQSRVFDAVDVEAAMKFGPDRIANLSDRLVPQFNTNRGANELLPLTTTAALTTASPGSSCRGPIASLAKLYQAIMTDMKGEGSSVLLKSETIQDMTSRHREDALDLTFQHKLDFGLGVIVNSKRYGSSSVPYGFGEHASDTTFGHGGAQCAIGFADPNYRLAVAWVLNGLPGEPRHNKRNREINSAIYEDLGLV